jgi:hypothetical protein
MSPEQFAQTIKAKYPQYANIDDKELANRVVAKYPVYASRIQQPAAPKKPLLERAGEFVSRNNLPGSKIGENIGTSFAALKAQLQGNTAGAQAISKSAPTEKQLFGDVARSAALAASPMIPNPASITGAIGAGAAIGAVSGAGEAATENANITQGGVRGAGIGAVGGLFSKVLEKGIAALGRGVGTTGEKITNSIIKPSKADIEDGFNIGTIKKYNLAGSLQQISQKTDAQLDELTRQVNAKYAASPERINLSEILNKTIQESAGSKVNTFGSNTSLEGAFNQLKGEIAAVAEDGVVSIPEAVQVKRAAGHFGAWLYGAPDPDSTARQKVYNAFYRNLKTAIEENSPEGVKELNKQIGELIPVMNAVIRRIPVAERNNAISLTDIISLTGASIDPRSLSVFVLNQLSKSGKVGNALMQAGPAIERGASIATPAIRAGTSGLQAALPQDTETQPRSEQELKLPSGQPITEETARKVTEGTIGLGVSGGVAKLASQVAKKAGPSGIERIGDFLRKFDTEDLNQQLTLMDTYKSLFQRLGVDELAPDDLVKVLNKVMSMQK